MHLTVAGKAVYTHTGGQDFDALPALSPRREQIPHLGCGAYRAHDNRERNDKGEATDQ